LSNSRCFFSLIKDGAKSKGKVIAIAAYKEINQEISQKIIPKIKKRSLRAIPYWTF
jgi:hypothetical protein